MSHTGGLLAANVDRIESKDEHGWINDGWIIAQCQGPEAIANARRIVACWNLCEGKSTEQVEKMLVAGNTLGKLMDYAYQTVLERDDSRKAIKKFVGWFDTEGDLDSIASIVDGLRDVLDKVEP